ncbi:immunoglobulin-like domain-containing protein [Enterococcus sp. DIV0756]|uniref:LPXTG cell wall anchor domain-containing protein n=1 Tax=Enterococcus sp. DIV0756 TaxID=2774636 RepID=UPI003F220B87
MKRKYLTCAALTGLLVPTLLAAPTALATEAIQTTSEVAKKTEETPKIQSGVAKPAKETPTTPSQQPKVPTTTNGNNKTTEGTTTKPSTESSTVKPIQKPASETAASSEGGKETSTSTVEKEKTEVKPLDVNPFPPNKPTDTHPAINILPTQSIRKGSSFDPMKGVSANDKTDGDLTSKIQVTGTVDTAKVGEYLLKYSVTNSQGKTATQSAIIHVVEDDIGMYTIEIADFSLPKGSDYIQAIRDRIVIKKPDGTIVPTATANIIVAGHLSTDTPGTLGVEIAVVSEYNTITKKIVNIKILDTNDTIRLDVQASLSLEIGQAFDPYSFAQAYVMNAAGKEEKLAKAGAAGSVGIWAESTVDTTKTGTYQVTYTALAASGATITKTMAVTVKEKAEKRSPKILVENKVMYVGDKLDEDMIMAWAKTENPSDTIDGFKVMNGEIKVKMADNTLVETGEHTIEFYASTPEGETSTKTITLTVKNRSTDEPTKSKEETKKVMGTGNTVTNLANKKAVTTPATTQSSKQLPKTGEESSSLLVTMIGGMLVLLAFVLKRAKKAE